MIKNYNYNLKFSKDIIIVIIIVVMPMLLYLHLYLPKTNSINFLNISYTLKYYDGIDALMHSIIINLLFINTFGIWFITCKHIWRYIILVPFICSINQLFLVINSQFQLHCMDKYAFLISVAISIPLIIILILISNKLKYHNRLKYLTVEIDDEIQELWHKLSKFNYKDYLNTRKDLQDLRSKREQYDRKTYLKKLINLRDTLLVKKD